MADQCWILQIMPATDWFVVCDLGNGEKLYEPLMAWALVENRSDNGQIEREIKGLISFEDYIDFADELGNFKQYTFRPLLSTNTLGASFHG